VSGQETGTAVDLAPKPVGYSILRAIAKPAAMLELQAEITSLIESALKKDVDYGTIPGTKKSTLLKPGAERLCIAFGLAPTYAIVEREFEHDRVVPWTKRSKKWNNAFRGDRTFTWEAQTGESLGLYRYVVRSTLVNQDGRPMAEGLGSCSTMESKYIDRPRECENTVLKMAQKRALVAAVLNALGLSDRFTQDMEEQGESAVEATSSKTALEVACELPLPGKPGMWDGQAGKPLGSVPTKYLLKIHEWTAKKLKEKDDDLLRQLRDGCTLVMEARRDGSLDEPPAPIKPTDPGDGEREAEREALAADGMEDE
jgi:hypothetical protein